MSSVRSIHSRGWRFFILGGRCGAYAAKRRQAAAEKALRLSVKTSSVALKEVERLRSANEMHEAIAAERMFDLIETRQKVQSLEEERDHLRADADELMQRVREFQQSVDADAQSVMESNWQLVKDLRAANHEVIRQRERCWRLVRLLRPARRKLRALDRALDAYDRLPFHHIAWQALCFVSQTAFKSASRLLTPPLRLVQWAFLAPIFGRRGATEVQEALHHG
jgi:hypothetical protein